MASIAFGPTVSSRQVTKRHSKGGFEYVLAPVPSSGELMSRAHVWMTIKVRIGNSRASRNMADRRPEALIET
jgi:hypothetical protein